MVRYSLFLVTSPDGKARRFKVMCSVVCVKRSGTKNIPRFDIYIYVYVDKWLERNRGRPAVPNRRLFASG